IYILQLYTLALFHNVTSTVDIYTLSLHDALPIFTTYILYSIFVAGSMGSFPELYANIQKAIGASERVIEILDEQQEDAGLLQIRSEEHTSELQSRENLVCRLLLEKKKTRRKKKTF